MKSIEGSVTAPKGFKAAGISCGGSSDKNLALIYSLVPANAAAVYTTNQVKAAPILVTKENLESGRAQAILCNSGIANACTGREGRKDARDLADATAKRLKIPKEMVIVSSTGVIGRRLNTAQLRRGISRLVPLLSSKGGQDAAEAIMTTDTFPKGKAVELETKAKIGGIAKGAGMISPNMATMLCFITTDLQIDSNLLQETLRETTENSFNAISVDGETSTNDMVAILANGKAKTRVVKGSNEYFEFKKALNYLTLELAKMIVKDGEGATKFVTILVEGAKTVQDAKEGALRVAKSNLVKTALFGKDPNWGRVVAAFGCSTVKFKEENLFVSINGVTFFDRGEPVAPQQQKAKEILKGPEVEIRINLNEGSQSARVYTCDLSYDYVKVNSCYTA